MKIFARSGLRRMTALTSVLMLLNAGIALAAVGYLGWQCVEHPKKIGFGSQVIGISTRTQVVFQYRAVGNRFSALCRPDAQGLVTIFGDGTDSVVNAMLFRTADSLQRRYFIYGLDRPLTSAEKNRVDHDLGAFLGRESTILHMPVWVDGLSLAYNLACPTGNPGNVLRLSSEALSGIFSGAVDRWNNALLTTFNEGLSTCSQSIRVAVRSDTSEQTSVLKDYLSKRNATWNALKQPQLNTSWPPLLLDPCRGRGDAGMASCIAGQPNSIGYVGYAEAKRQGLVMAHVQNTKLAEFIAPSSAEFTRAAEIGAYPTADGDWSQTSITDGPQGYPISSLQYALAFKVMLSAYGGTGVSPEEVRTTKDWITIALDDRTQTRLERYGVAQLPETLRVIGRQGADSITYFE